ncbi:argininosuccinate lyase [Roseovarius sp. SYSU LYC5161]|uniref:argininosuccinate lyase n=1 Tax=Roseovarius halophilus (ex Wu et al. 2025) TaxID=3376060 RepID=UPI0028713DA2|nr:argininosuccinate lyase [Roseovarius sp.]
MRWVTGIAAVAMVAACGVDGDPVRPSVNTTVGASERGVDGAVGTDWVSGNVSVHVGTSL